MWSSNPGFSTLAIHTGDQPDPMIVVRVTSTYRDMGPYAFCDSDYTAAMLGLRKFSNIYTRVIIRPRPVWEERLAGLESGTTAVLAVASDLAAQLLVFKYAASTGR